MSKPKIVIAGHHCGNLSESAGFEQVTKFLPYDVVDANQFWFANAEFGTISKKINLSTYELYLRSIVKKYDLIHYLLPEVHLTFSMPSVERPITVGTIHLPLDVFHKENLAQAGRVMQIRKKAFDRFDSIVTVTRANENEIKKLFPHADVKFIPHGVYDYSSFYNEKIEENGELNIITAGTNFRDIELYKSITSYARQNKPNWKFHLLGGGKWKTELKDTKNITIHPYMDEKAYLSLFAKSDIHFLPLTFATANNALLEAHSVGTPTVVSDLESVKDYSLSTTRYFKNLDSLIFEFNTIENLGLISRNQIKSKTLEESSRFHWKQIAAELDTYYHYLLK